MEPVEAGWWHSTALAGILADHGFPDRPPGRAAAVSDVPVPGAPWSWSVPLGLVVLFAAGAAVTMRQKPHGLGIGQRILR
jgi:hypothetical protein